MADNNENLQAKADSLREWVKNELIASGAPADKTNAIVDGIVGCVLLEVAIMIRMAMGVQK